MAEQVVQTGRLGELPLVDLVMSACRMKHPSILRLERGGHRREFFFRDGELKALVTTNPAESLTAMLVRRKKLQSGVAEAAREVAERDGMGEASALMRDRLMPIPELVKEMNVWATLLMVSSFGWTDGLWSIVLESVENAPPDTLLELHLPATLLRGVGKKLTLANIKGPLEPFFEDAPRRAEDPPFAAVAFDLDARQQALLDALDGQRTLRELVTFSPIPEEEALRLLYVLQRLGMLEFGGDSGPTMATQRSESQPAMPAPRMPAPAPEPPSQTGAEGGLDWGSIKFSRRETTDRAGHYAASKSGQPERLTATGKLSAVEVGRAQGPMDMEDIPPERAGASAGLSSLFDGLENLSDPAPRRGGQAAPGWSRRRHVEGRHRPHAPPSAGALGPHGGRRRRRRLPHPGPGRRSAGRGVQPSGR